MARLLYISASSPVPSKLGPARRNFHVISQLTRGHEVAVLTTGTPAQEALFREELGDRVASFTFASPPSRVRITHLQKAWRSVTNRCDFMPAQSPSLRHECRELFRSASFDAVVLSHVLLRSLPLPEHIPIIGDTHNVEFDVLRRMSAASGIAQVRRCHAMLQWRATRREEARCANAVDLLLATSSRDAEIFQRELGISHVQVIENGIDLGEFTAAPSEPSSDVLFTGLMSYYPNQHAVRWLLDHVWPLVSAKFPTARLVIAGAAAPDWLIARQTANTVVTGAVPDMRPYLAKSAVVVAPIWQGGGTRVKILEAMATGRPVVSTTIGAEGLGATHGETILIADDGATFATEIVRLLSDRAAAERLGREGRHHVARHFDWEAIGGRLRHAVDDVIAQGVGVSTATGRA